MNPFLQNSKSTLFENQAQNADDISSGAQHVHIKSMQICGLHHCFVPERSRSDDAGQSQHCTTLMISDPSRHEVNNSGPIFAQRSNLEYRNIANLSAKPVMIMEFLMSESYWSFSGKFHHPGKNDLYMVKNEKLNKTFCWYKTSPHC